MAADYSAKEAVWLRALLQFLGYEQGNPTIIQCDNNGAISLTKNATFHNRTGKAYVLVEEYDVTWRAQDNGGTVIMSLDQWWYIGGVQW